MAMTRALLTIFLQLCGAAAENAGAAAGSCQWPVEQDEGIGGLALRQLRAEPVRGLMKGISYGPSPLVRPEPSSRLGPNTDYFCEAARPQWGPEGRGDLLMIKAMGANTVRLYGNDPGLDHRAFLDHAHEIGLSAMPGISDFAYIGRGSTCVRAGTFDCYADVKKAYGQNLQNGFLLPNHTFHPALSFVVAINEPDLLPGIKDARSFAKSVASAIDGMLDAEKEAKVIGARPNLTTTFSFSMCPTCSNLASSPGLAQMWMLRDALQHPEHYDYVPKNDLQDFYRTRFTNSFNTKNPSHQIQELFLKKYEAEFSTTPVFLAEYHDPDEHDPNKPDTQQDLISMLAIAKASPLLLGLSFFEFQNRHDEGGHSNFGIFDVYESHDSMTATMNYLGTSYRLPCLSAVREAGASKSIAEQIATAFGGSGLALQKLCQPTPELVPVSSHGFDQVQGLRDAPAMARFIRRVVRRMGGDLLNSVPASFAEEWAESQANFKALVAELELHPDWATWNPTSACVVNKAALIKEVANKISYTCGLGVVDCNKIVPSQCKADMWNTASFVFGSYYKTLAVTRGELPDPFKECFFEESARFTSPSIYASFGLLEDCVVPVGLSAARADTVQVCPRAFRKIAAAGNASSMGQFIRRVVRRMGGDVPSSVPESFARGYLGRSVGFVDLAAALARHPSWATWSPRAACVAEPKASEKELGKAVGYVCGLGKFDCTTIPENCKKNVHDHASFVFSSYFRQLASTQPQLPEPVTECFFDGIARFSSPSLFNSLGVSEACAVAVEITTE